MRITARTPVFFKLYLISIQCARGICRSATCRATFHFRFPRMYPHRVASDWSGIWSHFRPKLTALPKLPNLWCSVRGEGDGEADISRSARLLFPLPLSYILLNAGHATQRHTTGRSRANAETFTPILRARISCQGFFIPYFWG